MKIAVVYITVHGGGLKSSQFATRFALTFNAFPAAMPHDLLVCSNGGPPDPRVTVPLDMLNPHYVTRSNDGWDIGAYRELAGSYLRSHDLMVCFGESVYFHRAGWLKRLAAVAELYGPGCYGMLSSHLVRPHLLTTCFATHPDLITKYPRGTQDRRERYEFEHGDRCYWKWLMQQGKPVRLVTWDGDYDHNRWRQAPNILWRGDQSNCLVWCNHTDNYQQSESRVKMFWAGAADCVPRL